MEQVVQNPELAGRYLSLDWLNENASLIHYFGLGFIQVKISESERMHFYTSKLPRTTQIEEIHTHRYNFQSQILAGTLRQSIHHVTPDYMGLFWCQDESCNQETKVESKPTRCTAVKFFEHVYTQGDAYYIDHHSFHQVQSHDAITLLKRGPIMQQLAQIVYPVDTTPVCPFSVPQTRDDLLVIMGEMLHGLS